MKLTRHFTALAAATALSWAALAGSLSAQDAAAPAAPAPADAAPAEATTPPVAAPAAALPDATLEQRVADIEQYFQNLGVGAGKDKDGKDVAWKSKIVDVPGPGHNGWMMTSSALVLFMTLPGLRFSTAVSSAKRMCSASARSASAAPVW